MPIASRQERHGREEKGCLTMLVAGGSTALLLAKPLHPLPNTHVAERGLTLAWLVAKNHKKRQRSRGWMREEKNNPLWIYVAPSANTRHKAGVGEMAQTKKRKESKG